MAKSNRTVRFDPNDLKLADELNIDVNDVSRKALKVEISFRLSPEFKNLELKKSKVLKKKR